jgi:dihydrofolate synthase/folylpolyglutamate synthase
MILTYPEVLDYLYQQLPMFHRVGKSAYKANLNNAEALDSLCNYPHKKYKTIHVAGTNGKGSVSHMLAAILQTAGYKTGLFTSPHLKDFRERIRVNGQMVTEDNVVQFVSKYKEDFDRIQPSFFEMTSAFAFEYFAEQQVDIAIIEVGLGGRLDSTNIITPEISIITNIGMDHTDLLGNTLAKIAGEKAGIIKSNIPVVIGEYNEETWPVFESAAKQNHSPISLAEKEYEAAYSLFTTDNKQVFNLTQKGNVVYPNLKLELQGFYQRKNISTVITAIDRLIEAGLTIWHEHIYSALSQAASLTGLAGRWQTLQYHPLIICDTAHNTHGMKWIVEQIAAIPCKHLHIVFGMVNDKDITSVIAMMPKEATYYFTNASIPRAMPANELMRKASDFGLQGAAYPSVKEALEAAKKSASSDDFIFVGGSTFIVAEIC